LLAKEQPYGQWLASNQVAIDALPSRAMLVPEHESLLRHQHLFGVTEEEVRLILSAMAASGEEPIGSMGSDSPIALLSSRPRPLFDFFTQQFAQVTNPPLDAIREELVTSIRVGIGPHSKIWPRFAT
jgi:glutamate synthase (NADPH/NADH) large chain